MEFTGDYYKCNDCGHIWDYMDICPNCGKDDTYTLNAHEVNEISERLINMLKLHADYRSKDSAALPLQVVRFSEARAEVCKKLSHWKTCESWTDDCRCLASCIYHLQT